MISNFSIITSNGVSLKLNLTSKKGASIFEGNDKSDVQIVINSLYNGIKWDFGNSSIKLIEPNVEIIGYPTVDLEKVIVIFPKDHHTFAAPNNAIIYNANGSIYLQLTTPKLKSELAKQRRAFMKNDISFFEGVNWDQDNFGNKVNSLRIGFDFEWWESRVLNPFTGEFGDCLSSGRR